MGKENDCRICEKKYSSNFASLFDSKVKVHGSDNYLTSYFEAIQQLTGTEIDYDSSTSNNICLDCQNRVKLAYKIRGELVKAFERKTKEKTIVYQIIQRPDGGDSKNGDDISLMREELVEITEVDEDYNLEVEQNEQVYVDEAKIDAKFEEYDDDSVQDGELITDDQQGEEDAVSFLLDKKDLFKNTNTPKSKSKRSHKCEVCEKTFMRKSNLVDHLRLHANVRLYKCEYCSKEFVQAGNYRSHLRIHTKERPYKCSMCPKTYNQSSALKVHIRSHTNEKNYVCSTCDKGFTNSSDLNKHVRVHDASLKIQCDFCDKTFAQRVNLKNHILRHHSDKSKGKNEAVKKD